MTTNKSPENDHSRSFSRRQQLFFRYTLAVLIDLTVLNLFNQYWDHVFIEFFSISLLAAVLLQILLKVTIAIEHRVAAYFKTKPGLRARIQRFLSAWGIIFGSKLVMLEAISFFFGTSVVFSGPVHGLITFIVVVLGIIVAERAMLWVYQSLA